MRKRAFTLLLTLLLTTMSVDRATAVDLKNVLADYLITTWSRWEASAPAGVWAVAQDTDGYLWLGTDDGLIRFDGIRFTAWSAINSVPMRKGSVRALTVDRHGTLWAGFSDPGGVSRIERGVVTTYGEAEGLGPAQINALIADGKRGVLAGSANGLYRFVGERWEKERDFNAAVRSLFVSRSHVLFVGTDIGLYRSIEEHAFEHVGATYGSVLGISADSEDNPLVTDDLAGFRALGKSKQFSRERGRGNVILHDSTGAIWVATRGQGLWHIKPNAVRASAVVERTNTLTGLAGDWVYALFEDREGNIWAGSPGGLTRLAPRRVTPIMNIGPVGAMEVTSDGSVWVEAVDKLIRFSDSRARMRTVTQLPVAGGQIVALSADLNNSLWIATNRRLLKVVHGRAVDVPLSRESAFDRIDSISPDHSGGIWINDSDRGLFHLGVTGRLLPVPDLGHLGVLAIRTDARNRLWLTHKDGTIQLLQPDGVLRSFTSREGVPSDTYTLISEDRKGAMWFGGAHYIARFDDHRFGSLRIGSGSPIDKVISMVQDDRDSLWVGTTFGIVRIRPDKFEAAISQPSHVFRHSFYNLSDGLAGSPVTMRGRAVRAGDGALWFLTSRGITVIDPVALDTRRAPQPVTIETIIADERRFDVHVGVDIPPRTSRIEIDYTTLELRAPQKTSFRYRLDGFDTAWVDAGTRRQALYTNLPPGQYRFRVSANNDDGVWNESGSTVDFRVKPMFYQTGWAYLACVGMLGLCVFISWRMHVRQVGRRYALLLNERLRLSHEIHDTLLQGLVGVGLQFDAISMMLGPSSSASGVLDRTRDLVDRYIRDSRYAIWNLRSPLRKGDIAATLTRFGEDMTAGAVRFDVAVSGAPRVCSAEVEEQLLRIGQEAVLNAVRHAHATEIRMNIHFDAGTVTLKVEDDGLGFQLDSSNGSPRGHWGLVSMKERSETLGGRLRIVTSLGHGTQVEAVMPSDSQ